MIENINLNLLSGGYFRCDPAWSRIANSLDRCYKVYFPVSGAALLEMESGEYAIRAGQVYFISGFKLHRQICAREMKVYWLHFIPESFYFRHILDQLPAVRSWRRIFPRCLAGPLAQWIEMQPTGHGQKKWPSRL